MKKTIATIAVSALLLAAMPMTALAHGGSHSVKNTVSGAVYSLCPVEDCNMTGIHRHDGTAYAGHYAGDGHDYHLVCGVKNCTRDRAHRHSGIVCLPHNNTDGHGYHGHGHKSGGRH